MLAFISKTIRLNCRKYLHLYQFALKLDAVASKRELIFYVTVAEPKIPKGKRSRSEEIRSLDCNLCNRSLIHSSELSPLRA